MEFVRMDPTVPDQVEEMSRMATEIVREHFDPVIGKAQNDYMLSRFQTPEAVREQAEHGSLYFFVREGSRNLGFLAFYPRENCLYLSKFYLYRKERGRGLSHEMIRFVADYARQMGLPAVELNVNRFNPAIQVYEKLGLERIRAEKNDIGNGFFMDDYVYRLNI